MEQRAPIAFISHSECDDAFCHELYDALCQSGIRPIMDKRDFQPGDDLVRRVYDEGIGESDCVIFVLSPESVDSPWLRDELSVSVVQKIGARTRLIPLLINGLPKERVPVALSATIWIRVEPGDAIKEIAARIATAMHGDQQANPVVGPAPSWTTQAIGKVYGLNSTDEVILKYICERRLESLDPFVSTRDILSHAASQGIPESEIETVLAVLDSQGYMDHGVVEMGSRLPVAVRPNGYALETYLKTYHPERYATIFQEVVGAMVNERAYDLESLKAIIDAPAALLDHVVDVLNAEGEIIAIRSMGGHVAWHVKPTLKRRLQSQ